ncbi:hypothetical protein KAT36_00510 [Candidatus Pacearchaeota archaeon]|nr:hypothetical protein [Candidatus Pacearchaeota archaeon]
MELKYLKEPIAQNKISDELPFAYSEKIKPIVTGNTTLNPDFHNFDLCFAQTMDSYIDNETEVEDWDGIKIAKKESLLYLSLEPRIFTHGDKIEKYITSEQSCRVPNIIDMFMKEKAFTDIITRAKTHIITYGEEPYTQILNPNGLGLILNREGNFYEGCLNGSQLDFLAKYFQSRGGFIENDQLKGLDYHLSWEKYYNELIK